MNAFFNGTVIILYFIAHNAAEIIFVLACFLPIVYAAFVACFLRFGGCGRMIRAQKGAKRIARKGVISGTKREAFYEKCVKRTAPCYREAFQLFTEGRLTAKELSVVGVRSVTVRTDLLKGGSLSVGFAASLLVFLTFYFIVPIGETLLRTAICAFLAAVNGFALHFSVGAYALAGEKAAVKFSEIADALILRKKEIPDFPKREMRPFPSFDREERVSRCEKDRDEIRSLRALLRDIDAEPAFPDE